MHHPREVIQSLYDAFARGDVVHVLGTMSPDIQWFEAEGSPLARGNPYDSPARIGAEVFGHLVGQFDNYSATPEAFVCEGDQVVVFGRYTGTRRTSGAALDAPFVHHWTVKGGQATRFHQYTDTAQMVRHDG